MTALEQLAIWAAAPNDEVFAWLDYPQDHDVFVRLRSAGKPHVVSRFRAADFLSAFQHQADRETGVAATVLARFQEKASPANTMRVGDIKGIACVILEGNSPLTPHVPYRLILSSVEPFI
jgi:hypothetical protein